MIETFSPPTSYVFFTAHYFPFNVLYKQRKHPLIFLKVDPLGGMNLEHHNKNVL